MNAKYIILYNPLSGNKSAKHEVYKLDDILTNNDLEYVEMTPDFDYKSFMKKVRSDERVVLCGGDGTIHRFINEVDEEDLSKPVFYFPLGSGNDFNRDVHGKLDNTLINLNNYMNNLPLVTVKGQTTKFLNNVSFGIDDYGNRIIVGMKSIDSTVLEWFRNTISDHSAIAFVEDDNAIFSVSCGQQIQGNNELISIGYRAKHIGANNNITKGFVTCGHAFYGAQSSSLAVQYNGSTIGTWTSAFQSFADGGYADAAFITKSGSTDITPQVVSSNSDPTINIGTAGYVDVAQGSTVFEQGAIRDLYYGTYGTGTITLSSYSSSHTINQTTIHLYDMVKTNYTAMVGDSGGIVFTYSSTAYYPCGCQSSILTTQTQFVWINGVKIFYGDGVYSKAVNIDSVLGGIYVR